MKRWKPLSVIVILSLLMVIACKTDTPAPSPTDPPAEESQPTDVPPTQTLSPTDTLEPTPTTMPPTRTPTPEEPDVPALDPQPQEITFEAEDGQVLTGRYYPAVANPAPVLVLMHWAPGDMEDWNEIAFWFQNRGLGGTSPNVDTAPWLDPTWFPAMFEDQSFAVFTFTFRGCEGGCSSFDPDGWQMDALAALKTASELEGVDPTQLATLGASIGSDGAPDACGPMNAELDGTCLGALSLSPGSYLNVPYDSAVDLMEALDPPRPVWCLYSLDDAKATETCKSASGDLYQIYEWETAGHGMKLFIPGVDPNAMQLTLDWLALLFGL